MEFILISVLRGFACGPVVKILCLHYRGPRFDPRSGKFSLPCSAAKKKIKKNVLQHDNGRLLFLKQALKGDASMTL